MQKIMFNDKYGLTDLVLSGQKTQTRRVVKEQYRYPNKEVYWDANHKALCFRGKTTVDYIATPRYYVGEMVAVAMSYKSIYKRVAKNWEYAEDYKREHENLAGWNNKMFTNTKMPFAQIKITNIRVERLLSTGLET